MLKCQPKREGPSFSENYGQPGAQEKKKRLRITFGKRKINIVIQKKMKRALTLKLFPQASEEGGRGPIYFLCAGREKDWSKRRRSPLQRREKGKGDKRIQPKTERIKKENILTAVKSQLGSHLVKPKKLIRILWEQQHPSPGEKEGRSRQGSLTV